MNNMERCSTYGLKKKIKEHGIHLFSELCVCMCVHVPACVRVRVCVFRKIFCLSSAYFEEY